MLLFLPENIHCGYSLEAPQTVDIRGGRINIYLISLLKHMLCHSLKAHFRDASSELIVQRVAHLTADPRGCKFESLLSR